MWGNQPVPGRYTVRRFCGSVFRDPTIYAMRIFSWLSLALLLIGGLNCVDTDSGDLFFVFNGPSEVTNTPQVPYETRIYSLDENNKEFKLIWSMGKNKESEKIGLYPSDKVLLFQVYESPEIYLIKYENLLSDGIYKIQAQERVNGCFYFKARSGTDYVLVNWTPVEQYKSIGDHRTVSEFYQLDGQLFKNDYKSIKGDYRVSGIRAYGVNESDIISLPFNGDSVISVKNEALGLQFPPILRQLIKADPVRGGVLIANEPEFAAIQMCPNLIDLTHQEILVLDKIKSNWKSVLVKGGDTNLRLVNNYLVGQVLNPNPKNDYVKHKGEGAIVTEEVAFIDPVGDNIFYSNLGNWAQVLLIEGSTVYYSIGDKLLTARITEIGLEDIQLLLQNSLIRDFQWAFRVPEGGKAADQKK